MRVDKEIKESALEDFELTNKFLTRRIPSKGLPTVEKCL